MERTDQNPQTHGPACETRASEVLSRRRHSHRYADSIQGRLVIRAEYESVERALQTL